MLLYDATHTSHSPAQTGIQRVCRSLFMELSAREAVTPVCYDPHLHGWRGLDTDELAQLRNRDGAPGGKRGASWSLAHRLRGTMRRLTGLRPDLPGGAGLVCPELFTARTGARLPALLARVTGPRIALFHDALALQYPELSPPATVARMPGYLEELRQFDGIAAVSEDSAAVLRDYWHWLDLGDSPPVHAIPLAVDPLPPGGRADAPAEPPRILCVGTLEGRKNHLALLEAADLLWREGLAFELELVGLARPETAGPALTRLRELQAAGRPLHYHGSVTEEALHRAYRRCAFTVYPSLREGFGLPVIESLQHHRPCICSAAGALGESARDGGCLALASVDAASLAAAIRRLLLDPELRSSLSAAAGRRHFRTWRDYARELREWMLTLPSRS